MEFIDERKKKLGFDFDEMTQLAQEDPEEFLRQKRKIFQKNFPDLNDAQLDLIFDRFEQIAEQGGDDPINRVAVTLTVGLSEFERTQDCFASIANKRLEIDIQDQAIKEASQIPIEKKH